MTKFDKELHEALDEYFAFNNTLSVKMYKYIKNRCGAVNR